ncbi:hypothetical protein [Gulosibacter sp. 10]|uniref:hypothetical protein n=1 Tax=Gulosibacter sp. 10 TaxID=1255570 RepID=UPI00097EC639|nr:hypothetical protein [Gulosibacter sp. 10]SJM67037.1 hypothetical protein FM112_12220 [Gulosibacter sp. 10]
MLLSEDAFRALASSSPWRWRALEFVRHATAEEERVEARIDRPGRMRLTDASGHTRTVVDRPGSGSFLSSFGYGPPPPPPIHRTPLDVIPPLRADGLVAERPERIPAQDGEVWVHYDDPMEQNYRWVAMLDPYELSTGTTATDLALVEHRGRPAWAATMTAIDGYEPRCGCCPLLHSAVAHRDEYGPDEKPYRPFPEWCRVMLDVETGVVVSLVESDGRVVIDLEIAAVE